MSDIKKAQETCPKDEDELESEEDEDCPIDFDWAAYWENDWQKDVGYK